MLATAEWKSKQKCKKKNSKTSHTLAHSTYSSGAGCVSELWLLEKLLWLLNYERFTVDEAELLMHTVNQAKPKHRIPNIPLLFSGSSSSHIQRAMRCLIVRALVIRIPSQSFSYWHSPWTCLVCVCTVNVSPNAVECFSLCKTRTDASTARNKWKSHMRHTLNDCIVWIGLSCACGTLCTTLCFFFPNPKSKS